MMSGAGAGAKPKLDLAQITNHPLVVQSSKRFSDLGQQSGTGQEQQQQQQARPTSTPVRGYSDRPTMAPGSAEQQQRGATRPYRNSIGRSSFSYSGAAAKEHQSSPGSTQIPFRLIQSSPTAADADQEGDRLANGFSTANRDPNNNLGTAERNTDNTDNNNNNNNNKNNNNSRKKISSDTTGNFLHIRRSTSLSYTSTLRRRQMRSPLEPQPDDLASPRPNVVLPNFSISPYESSTARRSLTWCKEEAK